MFIHIQYYFLAFLASAKLLEMNENRDQLLNFVRSAICGSRDWEGRINASAKLVTYSEEVI